MSLLCYYLFILYKLLNMFRATMCPSSGADDCVVLSARVDVVSWLQEGCQPHYTAVSYKTPVQTEEQRRLRVNVLTF